MDGMVAIDRYLEDVDDKLEMEEAMVVFTELEETIAQFPEITIRKIYRNTLGVWFVQMQQSYADSGAGAVAVHGNTLPELLQDLIYWFESQYDGDDLMNLFKSKLFKNIEGIMVKDNPMVLTIKDVRETVLGGPQGDKDAYLVYFVETDKGAVMNKTSAKAIIADYGPDTDAWKGKGIRLYAEFGKWFGKETWALRMAPAPAPKKATKKEPEPQASGVLGAMERAKDIKPNEDE